MKKKVKVLQVLDFINYNSGVSAVVMNYFFHMDYEKVQSDFLLYEAPEEEWCVRLAAQGAKIYKTGQPSGTKMLQYKQAVEKFFAQHGSEYDIIHVHIPNAAFVVLRYAKKYGISVRIVHSHNARGADSTLKKIRNYVLNKWGILYANKYFACGKAAGEYLFGEKAAKQNQIQVLPNAIDLKKYAFDIENRDRIRTQLGVKEDELLLGNIGRFAEQKNHIGLLEIFEAALKSGINAKLLLIGDGELRETLEEKAKELGIPDKITFAGVVNNVNEYLSAMDMFLLPSLYEGLPVVCVEAQAAGLPCLVSDSVTTEIRLTSHVYFMNNSRIGQWCQMMKELSEDLPERKYVTEMDQYDIEKQADVLERKYFQYGQDSNTDVYL